jgi:aspartate-semialdehyde dehydrogenase
LNSKLKVGIVGATGMVGQRFVSLLHEHPWFEVSCVAASERSAGKSYMEAVKDRWFMNMEIPENIGKLIIKKASDIKKISEEVDFVFCAVNMDKTATRQLEEDYAKTETPVVSNNSANRMTEDVPMVIPEINSHHFEVIESQKKRLGTKNGFIAVKPNCSIQSYVPAVHALMDYKPLELMVCTYQGISGAGKTFESYPDILDNVVPFIRGEEGKSENEPMKIWGEVENGRIVNADEPLISAQCIRVPVSDGHMAAVFIDFERRPEMDEILSLWENYKGKPQELNLPNAPKQFLKYFKEDDRPQTKYERNYENGMGITIGRLREDPIYNYKFVCLSHNTLRGAAGGGVLIAELLKAEGYISHK